MTARPTPPKKAELRRELAQTAAYLKAALHIIEFPGTARAVTHAAGATLEQMAAHAERAEKLAGA